MRRPYGSRRRDWRSAVSPLPLPSEGRSGREKEGARVADRKSTVVGDENPERAYSSYYAVDGSKGQGRPARAVVRACGDLKGSAGVQLRGGGGDVPPPRGLREQRMASEGELRGRVGLGALGSLCGRRWRGPRPPSRDARGRDDRTGRGGTQTLCGTIVGGVSGPALWGQAARS